MDINHGPVKRFSLPDDWKALPYREDFILKVLRGDEKDVEINFYFRGKPSSKTTATQFQLLLAKPPHKLTPEELLDLEVVIRDASEDVYFKMYDAYTEVIAGKTVYVVTGYWKLSEVDSMGIFVDTCGNGQTIDEIYYLAPPDVFQKYLPEFRKALETVEWNKGSAVEPVITFDKDKDML